MQNNWKKNIVNKLIKLSIKENFFEFPWQLFLKHEKKSSVYQSLSEYKTEMTSLFHKTTDHVTKYVKSSNIGQENILKVRYLAK